MDLSVTVEAQGASAVAHLRGEVDAYTAPQLRQLLSDLSEAGHGDLILHLAEVPFVDSAGLGVLVGGLKRQRALGGTLRLAALDARVLRVFRVTGLDAVFDIHPDVDEALKASRRD